jgi:hypothetical protein
MQTILQQGKVIEVLSGMRKTRSQSRLDSEHGAMAKAKLNHLASTIDGKFLLFNGSMSHSTSGKRFARDFAPSEDRSQ